jgi:FkbM family methyltransferase
MLSRLKLGAQRLLAWGVTQLVGPHADAVLTSCTHGLQLLVDPQDQGVGRQLRMHGQFQPQELQRLLALVQAQDRVLVVGAHVGALALPLARQCRAVVAIEANPLSFSLLQKNLLLNDVRNCQALALAANHESGTLTFLQSRTNSGGSKRLPLFPDTRYIHDKPQEISVRAERLDDVLADHHFDLILMDIEGSEVFALRGMPRLLKTCRCLVVEFLPHHLQRVAGVSVREFLQAVPDHLQWMQVPSTGACVPREVAQGVLDSMMHSGRGDDGLIFTAQKP